MMMVAMKSAHTMQSPYPIIPFHSNESNTSRVIAFTTPLNYAGRLSHLLHLRGWNPLWCPTVIVEITPQTKASIQLHLSTPPKPNPNSENDDFKLKSPLEQFSAIAFTSRTGITAFSEALTDLDKTPPLAPIGDNFTISALGKDSELIDQTFICRICENSERIRVLVPPIATPSGLVESLGLGRARRVLCPVPLVIGLEEPPVVPNFLNDLASKGWVPVRVNGYETRWAGPECAEEVVRRSGDDQCCGGGGGLDAIVFTSTGEVEGLLKCLKEFGLDWAAVRRRFPRMVVAAHGPVTAAGAERLGVGVDVVSERFDSFSGVVDALAFRLQSLQR